MWLQHFNHPIDKLPEFKTIHSTGACAILKDHFFKCPWHQAYDFLEFLLTNSGDLLNETKLQFLNVALKQHNAAYRIVGRQIVEITDKNEIKAIEEALGHTDAPVRAHIESALKMLSDREAPDYRNSIKESISAVEAVSRLVTGLDRATLGEALKKVPDLHPALVKGFLALYGFTNDAAGIRHSLLEESNLTYADAKFMLASCAAFVSYLRATAANP